MRCGLLLAGHADLQCTAAEEPTELSGWELVLDCALSELLSKLFPDDAHRMRPNTSFLQREMTNESTFYTQRGKKKERNVTVRSDGRERGMGDDMMGAYKHNGMSTVNLLVL